MLFQRLAMEGEEVRERMQQQIHDLEVRAKVHRVGPGEVDLREVEKTSALLRFDAKHLSWSLYSRASIDSLFGDDHDTLPSYSLSHSLSGAGDEEVSVLSTEGDVSSVPRPHTPEISEEMWAMMGQQLGKSGAHIKMNTLTHML